MTDSDSSSGSYLSEEDPDYIPSTPESVDSPRESELSTPESVPSPSDSETVDADNPGYASYDEETGELFLYEDSQTPPFA